MLHRLSTLALAFLVFSCSKEVIQQKLTVDWTPLNGGTVSPPTNAFEKGSVVSMVATPAGEYVFKQWNHKTKIIKARTILVLRPVNIYAKIVTHQAFVLSKFCGGNYCHLYSVAIWF